MALNCAICHEPIYSLLNFGLMPLANGYAEPDRREPLSIWYCPACCLYQLGQQIAPTELFTNYTYRTGVNHQHYLWRELMLQREYRVGALGENDPVVDIGGNDGTMVVANATTRHRLNVDPFAPEQVVAGVTAIRKPWNVTTANEIVDQYGSVRFATAANVWAHMPDLHESATAAAILLAPDGWLCIQAPWCRDFWTWQEYDTAYHEHVYYLGLHAMRTLFQQHHMDVHDVEYLPNVHGGSLRYWIRHGNDGIADSVLRLEDIEATDVAIDAETEQGLYELWQKEQRAYWQKLGQVWGIGAAAKTTMYLAMTGVAEHVEQLFDDTPAKQYKRLPGTQLVVRPLNELPQVSRSMPGLPAALFPWNHRVALRQRLFALNFAGRIVEARA